MKVAKKPTTATISPTTTATVTVAAAAAAATTTKVMTTSAAAISTDVGKSATSVTTAVTAKGDKFTVMTPSRQTTTNISKVGIPTGNSSRGTIVTGTAAATATTTTTVAAPLVWNSRNLLNKSMGNVGGTLMKLTPKLATSTASATAMATPTPTAAVTMASSTALTPTSSLPAGKTTIRTSQGQILYIQKATTTSGAPAVCVQATSGTAVSAAAAINKTGSVTTTATTASGATTAANGAGNKTVSIKVIRAAGGTLLPVKSNASTANIAMGAVVGGGASAAGASTKTSLTLSPNMASQFAGKRIITTSGGQVVIKTPLRSLTGTPASAVSAAITTNATINATSNTTTSSALAAKPISMVNANAKTPTSAVTTSKMYSDGVTTSAPATTLVSTKGTVNVSGVAGAGGGGKIYVQSASGKQIVVSNQHILKLPAKQVPASTGASAVISTAGTLTSSAMTVGSTTQLHTIQLPGKSMQYVRVLPKVSGAGAASTTMSVAATASSTAVAQTSNAATSTIKILNTTLPQKITVVRPSPTTKLVLAQSPKKDGVGVPVTFSPITSKVQKTIVTVPTLRSIGGDKQNVASVTTSNSNSNNSGSSTNMQSLIRTSQATMSNTSTASAGNVMLRKHKISEINSELKRMTNVNEDDEGSAGSGPPENKKHRIVVLPRSMLRSCVGGVQSGVKQVTVQSAASTRDYKNGTGTGIGPGTGNTNDRDRMDITRSQLGGGQQLAYSMLKGGNIVATTDATRKALLICGNAQALIAHQQQQHKTLQLKKRQSEQIQTQYAVKPAASTHGNSNSNNSRNHLGNSGSNNHRMVGSNNTSNNQVSVRIKVEPPDQFDVKPTLEEAAGVVRRKHCNCSKSQCLKLYCDCFANGEFCQDCTCKDCFNNLQYEDERQRAIKNCLERNPSAFKPKITTSQEQGDMRHNKGCNCKRSGCLKNYCECYEAKIPCSSNCKCVGCRNFEERPDLDMDPIDPKLLASLANPSLPVTGQKRTYEKANSKLSGGIDKMFKDASKGLPLGSELITAGLSGSVGSGGGSSSTCSGSNGLAGGQPPEKQQCNFITQEVVDATIQCMISQADECEKNGLPAYQTEKMVMEEMGRCLVEIIDFSIRNTDSSFAQD